MTYLVLARKYRPQNFKKVIGQNHITKTLSNTILNNRIAHSILFSGPRGTGKTTIARILSKAINCQANFIDRPCNKCKSCNDINTGKKSDVFEIDGASNNSVEQIRDLQNNALYMPSISRAKIYIIDEVHMLSISAFNALLKILEEPPNHVNFLLATTEYHKLPKTIISRCQHHRLRLIETKNIEYYLENICILEKFKISPESLKIISLQAKGSLRDAISILDLIISSSGNKIITEKKILNILGLNDTTLIYNIAKDILSKNAVLAINHINLAYNDGCDLKQLYDDILEYFKHLLLLKINKTYTKFIDLAPLDVEKMLKEIKDIDIEYLNQIISVLYKEEAYIKTTSYTKLAFEIIILKVYNIQSMISINTIIEKIDVLKETILENNNDDYDIEKNKPNKLKKNTEHPIITEILKKFNGKIENIGE